MGETTVLKKKKKPWNRAGKQHGWTDLPPPAGIVTSNTEAPSARDRQEQVDASLLIGALVERLFQVTNEHETG